MELAWGWGYTEEGSGHEEFLSHQALSCSQKQEVNSVSAGGVRT